MTQQREGSHAHSSLLATADEAYEVIWGGPSDGVDSARLPELNEVEAARIGTFSLWMRPVAAIGAGFLADRFGAGNMTVVSFVLLIVGIALLASEALAESMYVPYVVTIVCASLAEPPRQRFLGRPKLCCRSPAQARLRR